MEAGAITALALAIAGLLSAMALLLKEAKRKRDSERPDPPPARPPLPSVDPAGETGPWPAQPHIPQPGLPPGLSGTLDRLEGAIAGLSGYASAKDIQELRDAFGTLAQALEDYRLDFAKLTRAHASTRKALLALQQTVHEQSEQIGRLTAQLEGGRAQ